MDPAQRPSRWAFDDEAHLPRLPVPGLEASAERFLAWCSPLLDAGRLAETGAVVEALLAPGSPARAWQAALEEHAGGESVPNWLDRFWTHRYLGVREPIAPDENFVVLFEDGGQDQVERAAGIVAGAVAYHLRLMQGRIPATQIQGRALSMAQQKYLFATTRIPGEDVDTVRAPFTPAMPGPPRARHVVVLRRGHAHRLEVLDEQGRPVPTAAIASGLREAVTAADREPEPGAFPGPLTALPRARWARLRRELRELSPANAELLETMETALLCLSLPAEAPADDREAGDRLLHGDGSDRWFDRSLSFVVYPDGRAGLSAEHSCLDGTTTLAFVDAVLDAAATEDAGRSGAGRGDAGRKDAGRGDAAPGPAAPDDAGTNGTGRDRGDRAAALAPLPVELDDRLRAAVDEAATTLAARGAAIATAVASVEEVGAERIKRLGVSPDAFVQLGFQLAHQRTRGYVGSIYEPIATRHYRLGRTETMRTVTPESLRFVAAMEDPAADRRTREDALRAAARAHTARARECQEGRGPERHLWTLQQLYRELAGDGAPEPELYRSPGWRVLRDDRVSTSSTPAWRIRYCGFAPTNEQCIGIAYMVLPQRVGLHLSAPRPRERELARFVERLCGALVEMRDLPAADDAPAS